MKEKKIQEYFIYIFLSVSFFYPIYFSFFTLYIFVGELGYNKQIIPWDWQNGFWFKGNRIQSAQLQRCRQTARDYKNAKKKKCWHHFKHLWFFFGSSADACILLLQSGFVQYTAESAAAALHVLKKLGCCLTWLDWTGPSISVTNPMFWLLLMCFAGFYNFLLFMSAQVFVSAQNLLTIGLHTICYSTTLIRAIKAPKVPFER